MCQRPFELLIADAELAAVVDRGHESPEALSSPEWQRYSHYIFVLFNGWEYLYYLHQSGSIPPELWSGGNSYFSGLAASKTGVRKFWADSDGSFAEPFHSHVEAAISSSAR